MTGGVNTHTAGRAAAHHLVLVHRDDHLDSIPSAHMSMLRLPSKLRGEEG